LLLPAALLLPACGEPPDWNKIGAAAAEGVARGLSCGGLCFDGTGALVSGDRGCEQWTGFDLDAYPDGGTYPAQCTYEDTPAGDQHVTCDDGQGTTRVASFVIVTSNETFHGTLVTTTITDAGTPRVCNYHVTGNVF
jgi:hypothetical protein